MDYAQAVAELASAVRFGIHPSLDAIRCMTDAMGRPQDAFKAVQVAGTNGKGSTARFARALFTAHGHSAGAFLSPMLVEPNEQVLIDSTEVSHEAFAKGTAEALVARDACVARQGEPVTQFELMTAAALAMLRDARVEWAVLEVGMGGRWDSTSVVEPVASVVTSVGLDHMEFLGTSLEEIAGDKAHVIKRGQRACVLGPGTAPVEAVFRRRARDEGVSVIRVCDRQCGPDALGEGDNSATVTFAIEEHASDPMGLTEFSVVTPHAIYSDLHVHGPAYQVENAACAIALAEAALEGALDPAHTRAALTVVRNPGRFELICADPVVVVDGAHNPHGARALAAAVRHSMPGEIALVIGVLADKAAEAMLAEVVPLAQKVYVCEPGSDRALRAMDLAKLVSAAGAHVAGVYGAVEPAVTDACRSGLPVLVTGSLRTVAEARVLLRPESSGDR